MRSNNTVVVLGKTGQVASELQLLKPEWKYLDRAHCNFENSKTIKSTLDSLFATVEPTVIVNAAAYTKVDLAEDEENKCMEVNYNSVQEIAKWCEHHKIKLIHVSTDYVFDGKKNTPYSEQDLTNPLNIYGKSKWLSEQSIASSGCQHVIYRTSWVYSKFGHNFLKTMCKLIPEKNLNIVFDQVGSPTLASDIASLIVKTIDDNFFPNKLYHFSNEGIASWYDFATMIQKIYLPQTLVHKTISPILSNQYPQKAQRPSFSVMNKSALKNDLNLTIDHWVYALERYQKNY
jgi:dTDP-4-dehydrorhamnose reductase